MKNVMFLSVPWTENWHDAELFRRALKTVTNADFLLRAQCTKVVESAVGLRMRSGAKERIGFGFRIAARSLGGRGSVTKIRFRMSDLPWVFGEI